ncbi:MAG: helix-turn-helix transcriptional regulator [Candidatus Helarchaeota archaeon]
MKEIENEELDQVDRIGWFQVQLLLQLAFQPKYGYEIINDMKLNNINISTGQVYPALKKLVNLGYLDTFSKRGRAARRKYYKITFEGLKALQIVIRSMLINLIPVMYNYLEDIKSALFEKYRINRGDNILLYSFPVKQALVDLARLVGDTGKLFFPINNEVTAQAISDLATYYNFDNVIKPVMLTKNNNIKCGKNSIDKAILMLFQKEKNLDTLLNEILRILKPNGTLIILSTKLNIFSETFLPIFDFLKFLEFFNGYTEEELKDICIKLNLRIVRSEIIKKINIVEAIKKTL